MTTQPVTRISESELARIATPTDEQGFGALSTGRGCLPLTDLDVDARIVGLVAFVTLEETFVNTLDEPIEATYIFPLPERAAVTGFRMTVGDRVIDGVLQERARARRDYDRAIAEGHRAAITEEERSGVFTMRVGNLMPGDRAVVRLIMTGPLPIADGEVTFRFPLVVAPRYIPGMPLGADDVGRGVEPDTDAVPDASRITPPVRLPGYPTPVRLSLSAVIDGGGLPLSGLRSSLHAIVESRDGGAGHAVRIQPGERVNRDFILRFRLGDAQTRSSLALAPDPDAAAGTFALTLVPPIADSPTARARSVAFVLDRSGSMGGWKMVAARRATARMVDTLNDRDRFCVLAFDDSIETPTPGSGHGLIPGTNRNRFQAVEFLARIEARGGTQMNAPLHRAVEALCEGEPGLDRILVLITDAQIGDEDRILRSLGRRAAGIRVFALGIDQAVNAGFLERLAGLGGGAAEIVESEDRLDGVMDRVHRLIATPVLTDLTVSPTGLELVPGTLVPRRLPDLFEGTPILITGRYAGESRGGMTITARRPDGSSWSATVDGRTVASTGIPAVWARGQVRSLEDAFVIADGDERGPIETAIVETSIRYGVLSRFTAFVAIDRSQVVNPDGRAHAIVQPVEWPDGWTPPGMPAFTALDFDASPGRTYLSRCVEAVGGRARGASAAARPAGGRLLRPDAMTVLIETVRELRAGMEATAPEEGRRLRFLRKLRDRLSRVLARIVRSGDTAAGPVAVRLAGLLDEIRNALDAGQPAGAELDRLWSRTGAKLERILDEAPGDTTPGARRSPFWK